MAELGWARGGWVLIGSGLDAEDGRVFTAVFPIVGYVWLIDFCVCGLFPVD